jgi:hypothetical protein
VDLKFKRKMKTVDGVVETFLFLLRDQSSLLKYSTECSWKNDKEKIPECSTVVNCRIDCTKQMSPQAHHLE